MLSQLLYVCLPFERQVACPVFAQDLAELLLNSAGLSSTLTPSWNAATGTDWLGQSSLG